MPRTFKLTLNLAPVWPNPIPYCAAGTPLYNCAQTGANVCSPLLSYPMPAIQPKAGSFGLTLTMKRVTPPKGSPYSSMWVQDDASYYGGSLGAVFNSSGSGGYNGVGLDNQGYASLPVPYDPITLPTFASTNPTASEINKLPGSNQVVPLTAYHFNAGIAAAMVVSPQCGVFLYLFVANINPIQQQYYLLTGIEQTPYGGVGVFALETGERPWYSWEQSSTYSTQPNYTFPNGGVWVGARMQYSANGLAASPTINYCQPFHPANVIENACPDASAPLASGYNLGQGGNFNVPVNFVYGFGGKGIFPFAVSSISWDFGAVVQNPNTRPGAYGTGSCCNLLSPGFNTSYTLTISGACNGVNGSYPLTWSGLNYYYPFNSSTPAPGPTWGWQGFINGWAAGQSFSLACSYGRPGDCQSSQNPTYGALSSPIIPGGGPILVENVTCNPLFASYTDSNGVTYTVS